MKTLSITVFFACAVLSLNATTKDYSDYCLAANSDENFFLEKYTDYCDVTDVLLNEQLSGKIRQEWAPKKLLNRTA